jgi:ubiquitin
MITRFLGFIGNFLTVAAVLCAPVAATAQGAAGQSAPTREGPVYDYRNHQPTAPAPAASDVTTQQVEDEVKALLKQTEELDRAEQQRMYDMGCHSGSSSASSSYCQK